MEAARFNLHPLSASTARAIVGTLAPRPDPVEAPHGLLIPVRMDSRYLDGVRTISGHTIAGNRERPAGAARRRIARQQIRFLGPGGERRDVRRRAPGHGRGPSRQRTATAANSLRAALFP